MTTRAPLIKPYSNHYKQIVLSIKPGNKFFVQGQLHLIAQMEETHLPSILSPSPSLGSFASCFFSSLFSWLTTPSCTAAKWTTGSESVQWINQ